MTPSAHREHWSTRWRDRVLLVLGAYGLLLFLMVLGPFLLIVFASTKVLRRLRTLLGPSVLVDEMRRPAVEEQPALPAAAGARAESS